MKMKVVDKKRKKILTVKVEITENMFIVAPNIINDNFMYLDHDFREIRKRFMTDYLCYCEYDKSKQGAKELEKKIINNIESMLLKEIHRIGEEQGVYFYLDKR